MRAALLLLLAALPAVAQEPDGASAAPARWSGPGGCASNSFRSSAVPVLSDVRELWKLELENVDRVEAPPVLWDGRGFALARGRKGRVLVAFDLRSGKELGRKTILAKSQLDKLRGEVALHVWDHMLFVEQENKELKAYKFHGRRFRTAWTMRKITEPFAISVLENEVYLGTEDNYLVRIRPYASTPSWEPYMGGVYSKAARAAVYGPLVFTVAIVPDDNFRNRIVHLYLIGLRRRDGRLLVKKKITSFRAEPVRQRRGSVTVGRNAIHIESPWDLPTKGGNLKSHVIFKCTIKGEDVAFHGPPGIANMRLPPAHLDKGELILIDESGSLKWFHARGDKGRILMDRRKQPELFRSMVPPTILGDIVYFGDFAVDLVTEEILWRLPVEEVMFPAVPADGLVLVVEKGATLRAFVER
ncbi:MAG: outer membrane protein assembly factor BamB family protein [Planctomycetota bacterium]